jgi:hypothetical protein
MSTANSQLATANLSSLVHLKTENSSSSPRLGWWIAIVVLAMVVMQFVSGRMQPEKQRPGTERNDLVLRQENLPTEIHGWKQSSFEAAKPAEQLTEGQFWWTHSWNYVKPPVAAYVALDQADWKSWHELTVCYQAVGWTLVDRRVVDVSDSPENHWPAVVATLEKLPLEKATLIFSMFGQDGTPLVSPFSGIPPKRESTTDRTVTDNFANRINYEPPPVNSALTANTTFDRVIQCQVLIQHTQDLPEAAVQDLIDLHHQTRISLRSAWLNHHSQLAQLKTSK